MAESTKKMKKKTVTAILGDSMVKDVDEWGLSDKNKNIVSKYLSGATTESMKTYIRPLLKRDPHHAATDVGTNNFRFSENPETIAENILYIASYITSM